MKGLLMGAVVGYAAGVAVKVFDGKKDFTDAISPTTGNLISAATVAALGLLLKR